MAETIITTLQTLIAGISSGMATAVESISKIFYNGAELTPLGVFLLVGFALSLVYFVVRFVMRIVRAR